MREAKFGRTRLVPLHRSTCEVLAEYIDLRADRRPVDHCVPGRTRDPPRPERSKPQPATDRGPFLLSLCGVRAADPRSTDPESARDSEQAIHAQAGQLSQPPGDRCVACSTGSKDMVGTTRPRLHPHRGADRTSAVRDDRAQTGGLRVGKTMLVKNLLHHAVLNGFTARFTMASDMSGAGFRGDVLRARRRVGAVTRRRSLKVAVFACCKKSSVEC